MLTKEKCDQRFDFFWDLNQTKYVYDDRQLPIRMNAVISGHVINWERYYDVLGRPQQEVLSNGMKVNYGFDDAGRLTYLSTEVNSEAPIARFEYDYNPSGTIKQIVKSFTHANQTTVGRTQYIFGYDELDRLTSASGEPNFVYDELGNQLQRGGQFNNLNHLLEDNEYSYSYTVNGELATKISKISGERTEYTWDDWGKNVQTRVLKADDSVKFNVLHKYDGFERRIFKTSNGSVTKFFYHGEDVIAEFSGDNKLLALYLHGPGIDEPIAMLRDINGDESFSDSEVFFYAKDHLGSVHALVDKNGKVVQRYSYSAYGKTRIEKIHEDDKLVKNPYAYTSREWEQETGDYFNRMRLYNPQAGRFLSPDPSGFEADYNLYRYVLNDPISWRDPDGFQRSRPIKDPSQDYGYKPGGGFGGGGGSSGSVNFIVSPNGTAYPVPKGAVGPLASPSRNSGPNGTAFTGGCGGANGQVYGMRITDPAPPRGNSPGYPGGYIKYFNFQGQLVDPYTGKTVPKSGGHYGLD